MRTSSDGYTPLPKARVQDKYVQPAYNKSGTRWVAQGLEPEGKTVNLGTFDTPERGQMAVRLFNHWLSSGYHTEDIPRHPRTRDSI